MKIVGLGDSTTAGTPGFFSPRERPPEGQGNPQSQYAYWMRQRHPEWEILNRGVRGQRTDQILRRFDWDVLPLNPDLVVVLAGVNDIHQDRELPQIQQNLTAIYDKVLSQKYRLLLCTILPLDILDKAQKEKIHQMNAWVRNKAEVMKAGFCDTYAALEDPARPGFLTGSPDDIHPDVEGYKKMGEAISQAIEKMSGK
jgi:lysophospholipase L1-like esterase